MTAARGASSPSAYEPAAEIPTRKPPIWLGEQECYSWGVTVWTATAAAVVAGWLARVATRNRAPRSA